MEPSLIRGPEVVSTRKRVHAASPGSRKAIRSGKRPKTRKEARMSQQVQEKYEESQLYKIRHSAAHVMAQAVLEMFPEGKIAIGPPIENGFYYDFDLPRPLTREDLTRIEARMKEIIAEDHQFQCRELSPEEARQLFRDQPYKLELIDDIL